MNLALHNRALRAPDGEGAGGGGNNGGGSLSSSDGNQGNNPPARPDYVPEKFWDAAKGAPKIEDLSKSYGELEKSFSKKKEDIAKELETARLAARPEKPELYKLNETVAAKLKEFGTELDDKNPLTAWWRGKAHDLGLDEEKFNEGVLGFVSAQAQLMPDPKAEMAKLGENASTRIEAAQKWAHGNLSEKAYAFVHSQLAVSADGVAAIEEIMKLAKGTSMATGEGAGTGGPAQASQDQLKKMMDDPRYWDPGRRDPNFVKQVQEGFRRINPV